MKVLQSSVFLPFYQFCYHSSINKEKVLVLIYMDYHVNVISVQTYPTRIILAELPYRYCQESSAISCLIFDCNSKQSMINFL